LPEGVDDEQLRELLFASNKGAPKRPLPEMSWVQKQLKRKGVTLQLLWEEYGDEHPDGYKYTQFCEYYKRWRSRLEPTLRQEHKAGEKMFVDWAGQTFPVWDPETGESRPAHLFVAVLGASNYTFCEAFENEQMPSWIEGHIHAYEACEGVAKVTVPDNPRTGVNRACRYEPELNCVAVDSPRQPPYHQHVAYETGLVDGLDR